MHRLLWYTAGSYFIPNRLISASLIGLSIADITYSAQGGGAMALTVATVVFKVATSVVYAYQLIC
jgi:hypothetical protein